MKTRMTISLIIVLVGVTIFAMAIPSRVSGCESTPTRTPNPPTSTQTWTQVPPTETLIPSTDTPTLTSTPSYTPTEISTNTPEKPPEDTPIKTSTYPPRIPSRTSTLTSTQINTPEPTNTPKSCPITVITKVVTATPESYSSIRAVETVVVCKDEGCPVCNYLLVLIMMVGAGILMGVIQTTILYKKVKK